MKKYKLYFLGFLGFFVSNTLYAQHSHNDGSGAVQQRIPEEAPHGGELKKAGNYKIEMVANLMSKKDQLAFYILKSRDLTIIPNQGVTGTIIFKQKDGTSLTEDLLAKEDGSFVAQLKDTDAFQVIVEFQIKGKTISTIFNHAGLIHYH